MVLRIVPVMGRGSSQTKCDYNGVPVWGPQAVKGGLQQAAGGVTHQESGGITGRLCLSSRSSEPQQQRGPC